MRRPLARETLEPAAEDLLLSIFEAVDLPNDMAIDTLHDEEIPEGFFD